MQKRILIALLSLGVLLYCSNTLAVQNNTVVTTEEHVVGAQADAKESSTIDSTSNAPTQKVSDNDAAVNVRTVIRRYNAHTSWYRHGRITANGERFNPLGMTAAHKSLPFGTIVRLTNPDNGRSVTVRINDRGPFIRGREFDLSLGAARALDMEERGVMTLVAEIMR